ncbi:helix-turn-helix transcriptional regulator [Bacillus sp. 03113]|uniref:helix-turn-helix transcriptional regulator n=1 Tax=Bacillus sp. 03113 TaxID=2578211 RepID=UPI00114124E9|nr:helix-turn-helix transcriptional regulator [Bacillus sp. 03113]
MSKNESFTTEEIAEILKVSKLTVYDLIKKGKLPAYRVGRQMRVDAVDLDAFKNKTKEKLVDPREDVSNTQFFNTQFYDPFANIRSIIISGQDNCLDILAKHFEYKTKAYRPLRSYVGSLNGLIAMYNGEADIVSTHLFDGETKEYNIPYVKKLLTSHSFMVIRFITRQAGFYVPHGNPKKITDWTDLNRPDIKILNREIGSGARILLDEQLKLHNINKMNVNGYDQEATSHFSVAAGITQGKADVGVGIEKNIAGIDFLPLVKENYDLVLLKTMQNKEIISLLTEILTTDELINELQAFGYDTSNSGKIIYEQ